MIDAREDRFRPRPPSRGRHNVPSVEQIRAQVEGRVNGLIRDLRVDCDGDAVILRGRSRTQHAKQLAQQAVLDLTEGPARLANQIQVG